MTAMDLAALALITAWLAILAAIFHAATKDRHARDH